MQKMIVLFLTFLGTFSLLACQQPINTSAEKVELEEFYLPITDVESSQFYIGMSYEDALEQLQH